MYAWMISPITGTGGINSPFRPTVGDVAGVSYGCVLPSNPDGTPKYIDTIVLVAASSLLNVSQVTNSFVFPNYNLDGQMSGMETLTRTAMVQSVQAYDMDGAGYHLDATNTDTESYRALMNAIGQQIEPSFNVNYITCPEVTA